MCLRLHVVFRIVAEEMSNYFPEEEGVMFIVHGENRDEENAERRLVNLFRVLPFLVTLSLFSEPVIEKAVSAANAFRPIDQNKNTTMVVSSISDVKQYPMLFSVKCWFMWSIGRV